MSPTSDRDRLRYPIGVVCRRTGLKPDVVRAWERRYGAVQPARSPGEQRLYSDRDLERLSLLHTLTAAGHTIGRIARLGDDDLRALAAGSPAAEAAGRAPARAPFADAAESVALALAAVERMDSDALDRELERAAADLGRRRFVEDVVAPLMHRVGELWRVGRVRPVHEHLASAVVKITLDRLLHAARPPVDAPRIVVGTPAGERHELGALACAVLAAADDWLPVWLGPDLPVQDLAYAANRHHARAIGLSVTIADDAAHVAAELRRLRGPLDPDIVLFLGGRESARVAAELEPAAVRVPADAQAFADELLALGGATPRP